MKRAQLSRVLAEWEVEIPATKMKGGAINHGTPRSVELTYNMGGSVWLLGLVDGEYLKMDKVRITGARTYEWLETRYTKVYTHACKTQGSAFLTT